MMDFPGKCRRLGKTAGAAGFGVLLLAGPVQADLEGEVVPCIEQPDELGVGMGPVGDNAEGKLGISVHQIQHLVESGMKGGLAAGDQKPFQAQGEKQPDDFLQLPGRNFLPDPVQAGAVVAGAAVEIALVGDLHINDPDLHSIFTTLLFTVSWRNSSTSSRMSSGVAS